MDFEQLLKACYNDVVRYSRAMAGSAVDGDDLLQDALIRAWKGFPRLNDPDRFKFWLLKIIKNTHFSRSRLQWAKRMFGLEAAGYLPSTDVLPYEEKELVRMALKRLPEAQREALILFEVLNMSIAEVAMQQKITNSAAKSRLARGRIKLREAYQALSNMEARHGARVVQPG